MTKKDVNSKEKKTNYVYFLCLINWQTILTSEKLKQIEDYIENEGTTPKKIVDWIKIDLDWENTIKEISKSELGFYHSRLLFKFRLKKQPEDIAEIRKIRETLGKEIKEFLGNEEKKFIKKIKEKANKPYIFYYPIFELNKKGNFWNRVGEHPYSLQTTCFSTILHESGFWTFIRRKYVTMRISGAQIIATKMSDWFFNTLINIVFHDGLYRQTRDEKFKPEFENPLIYGNLENMLEDFASHLMTIFHQYSSDVYSRGLQRTALIASIIGITLGSLYFILRCTLKI